MIPLLKKKKRVILDTNMLLMPGKGLDVFSAIDHALHIAYDFYVMNETFRELEHLSTATKKGSDKFNAKLGFIMAKQKGVKPIYSEISHVDDAIVDCITKDDYVATSDRLLQKRIQEKGAKLIVIKNKNQVMIKE